MNGAQLLASTLSQIGARTLFGLIGNTNIEMVQHFTEQAGCEYFSSRHEGGAIMMAAGWARATGRVGFATVTHGPGLVNALTSLTAAVQDRSPVVLIAGVASASDQFNPQQFDHRAAIMLTGAGVHEVHRAEHLGFGLTKAALLAETERRPQVLLFPEHLGAEEPGSLPDFTAEPATPEVLTPADSDVDAIAHALLSAASPIILAGQGALHPRAERGLIELAEATGALLATTAMGKGLFEGHPQHLGLCGGFATDGAKRIIEDSDLIVAFGASLNRFTTHGNSLFAEAKVIQIDNDLGALTRTSQHRDLFVHAAVETTVAALLRQTDIAKRSPQGSRPLAGHTWAWPVETSKNDSSDAPLDTRVLYTWLDSTLPRGRKVVTDGGRFLAYVPTLLHTDRPRDFIMSTGFAAIGLGLSTAAGVALAHDELTVLIVGDGGFLMGLADLDSLGRTQKPVLVVVVNDGAYGAELRHLDRMQVGDALAGIPRQHFAALGSAFGGAGATVTSASDLDAVAPILSNLDGLFILDARVDPSISHPAFA